MKACPLCSLVISSGLCSLSCAEESARIVLTDDALCTKETEERMRLLVFTQNPDYWQWKWNQKGPFGSRGKKE